MDVGDLPTVRVRNGLGDRRRPTTVLQAEGPHTYAGRALIVEAIEPIDGRLVIDLTACTYLDTYVIAAILRKASELRERGFQLEIALSPAAPLASKIQQLGIGQIVPIVGESPSFTDSS